MHILLVEDDELLGSGIHAGLTQAGYTVDWLKDGYSADSALMTEEFDGVVLDLGLPRMDGLQVLRQCRARGATLPVLILTARDAVEQRVKGLDLGADDYVTKPFDLDELCARLRALTRRSHDRADPTIRYGNIAIDPAGFSVTQDGQVVELSRRELALLIKLTENTGKAIARDKLNQALYGWDEEIDSNALEVHIHNLRKKLGNDVIKTIRGIGYMAEKRE